ncbi:MAG: 50S ribosomal protein L19 [Candidatus Campbellbacteria bacterium GW2011_GWD1_35_49]|nr:MAG: 50S ribosomal protein L19 [Candidatus Campbellbacteria bacterium GW2011_GWD2_35_24]KKP76223.1 MAG: ribosomal protein L19 [Candidatus Campbellbacteria bacterium GW2011_GWC2_35_28]KKP77412.1 MAG: 50S ribosomal protein L19 [Candidatus Campbellbacteria bacterium GW2011_GWC1_35_31]KKP79341.1 MAG: 50S ribosomal protein L19 [Candidatus Campbellbacteria bacterium GW2011_GWD1_35_49]
MACDKVLDIMKTDTINVSPVNMADRKALGIKAGDTVRVWVKIQEKGKTRLQAFEGLVLATKHGAEAGATFTVRKVSLGVGVERIFPLYSPSIDKIEIVKRANVRRAKLYHIRDKVAREIKRQMRKMSLVKISSLSDGEETDRIAKEEAEVEAKAMADKEAEAKAEAEAKVSEEANTADNNETVAETPAEEVKE